MSTVEVKISQLREASIRLNFAASQLTQSISTVRSLLDDLAAGSLQSEAGIDFAVRYEIERDDMDTWSQQLRIFAEQLAKSADEIEGALSANGSTASASGVDLDASFSAGMMTLGNGGLLTKDLHPPSTQIRSALPKSIRDPENPYEFDPKPLPDAEVEPEPLELDAYVSYRNRPLFEEMQRKENLVQVSQNQLDNLLEQRAEKLGEINALKNRLASFNANLDVDNSPRVVALQTQLDQIDHDIVAVRDRIDMLNGDINDLTVRLGRVTPGAGADLNAIAELEGGTTSVWVRASTDGCVNHVVNQMPIPEGIAADAHLWDDNAARLTQYGITSGDTPLQGSVLLMEPEHSYADDVYGHLMYVERVQNGAVWVTDQNHLTPTLLTDITQETTGDTLKYLYFPWHTQG